MADLASAIQHDENNAVDADVDAAVAAAVGLRLMGYSAREADGTPAAASFNIKHAATGAAGTVLACVELEASKGDHMWFGPQGLDAADGISIDDIGGTYDVTLYYQIIVPGG